jgi:nitroimidazol reductase NimA-like FMN-containing flavoprotein (pyridoxamine 5'-phosphate oxidase superfamily)
LPESSVEYEGVVVFGNGAVVKDAGEARDALHLLLRKYAPHLQRDRDYRGVTAAELKRTAVYRVAIESWSGKRKEAPPDFPGAFIYGAV